MSNKIFIILVVILSGAIIASLVALLMSIITYNKPYQFNKPSILVEAPLTVEHDEKKTYKPSNVSLESVPTPSLTETSSIQITTVPSNTGMDSFYIFPSDTTLLADKDLEGKTYDILNKAYNEIFARHGHDFQSAELKRYFSTKSWYNPTKDKVVSVNELTDVEIKNLQKIKQKIDEMKR